jgi:hypothetical protein
MTKQLEHALSEYEEGLDSIEEISSKKVMEIVERVTLPYLEKIEEVITADEWVDYLVQSNVIGSGDQGEQFETEAAYAKWVLETPITVLRQVLSDQPCDTPTAESLWEWAVDYLDK